MENMAELRKMMIETLYGNAECSRNLLLIFTMLCAMQDIRSRRVYLLTYAVFGLIGAGILFYESGSAQTMLLRFLPGTVFCLMARFLRGSVGFGDGLYYLVAGCYAELGLLLALLLLSQLMCGIAALFCVAYGCLSKTGIKRMRLPYLAFTMPALWILTG